MTLPELTDAERQTPWVSGRTWGSILADIDDRGSHADSARLAADHELDGLEKYLVEWLRVVGNERERRCLAALNKEPSASPG